MKKTIRWVLHGVGFVIVVAGIIAFFNREKIVRLYKVNTLFDEANIVHNFSHMKDMFFWAPVKAGGKAAPLDQTLAPLENSLSYEFNGKRGNVADRLSQFQTTSLLVLHEGRIVHEQYFLGTEKEDHRVSWSMAKSVLSAIFGIVIEEGKIASLDDPVIKYVPALEDTAYRRASIRNVLNMASGVKFNEDYLDYNSDIKRMGRVLALGGSMDEFAATIKETERTPGTNRQYVSIDTHVLAMILRNVTGKSMMDLVAEKLWSKMGSRESIYYLTDGHGVAFALGGLNMRTRDYARFGQLFLKNGKWGGEQIVPADWISQSTRVSAPVSAVKGDSLQYGYQWWMPPKTDDEYFAVGIYGQYIYVNPKAKIVVVKTAANRNFRADGQSGRLIKQENIAIFRAIAEFYSDWRYPADWVNTASN